MKLAVALSVLWLTSGCVSIEPLASGDSVWIQYKVGRLGSPSIYYCTAKDNVHAPDCWLATIQDEEPAK